MRGDAEVADGNAGRGVVPPRRPVGRAMGARSRQAGGARHRHAAGDAGAVPPAERQRRHPRRARRADPRSAAGSCCRSSASCSRPSPARPRSPSSARGSRQRRGGPGRRGRREPAQHAAGLDLARPAHAARGDLRRGEHARGTVGDAGCPGPSELAKSIGERAQDMARLVDNVLEAMRLESGDVRLRIDWQSLEDLAGAALRRLGERVAAHRIELRFADGLPPVAVDGALLEQVLANLVENAARTRRRARGSRSSATRLRTACASRSRTRAPDCRSRIRSACSTSSSADATSTTSRARASGWRSAARSWRCTGGASWRSRRAGGGARFEIILPLHRDAARAGPAA